MLKLGLIKSGIQLFTGIGVGYIADAAIAKVRPKHFTGIKKLTVQVGGYVLSAMAADKATNYVEKIWNDTGDQIKNMMVPKEKVVTEETIEEVEES